MPDKPGSLRVTVSPMRFGMTCPGVFSDPAAGEYQSVASGKRFGDLAKVPLAFADPKFGDLTRLPPRKGYTDLIACFARPTKPPQATC